MQTDPAHSKIEPSHYTKWREIMQDYEISGLSQIEYCEQHGHSFRQFKYYRSRFSQLSKSTEKKLLPSATSFTPISLSRTGTSGLRIELGYGAYCLMRSPSDALLINALLAGLR